MPLPDHISALPMPVSSKLDANVQAVCQRCREKLGLVPKVPVAFFNLSNRMAFALDMTPNPEYHRLDR